jgi:hypothetical protein
MPEPRQKITLAEMRAAGIRGWGRKQDDGSFRHGSLLVRVGDSVHVLVSITYDFGGDCHKQAFGFGGLDSGSVFAVVGGFAWLAGRAAKWL